jgi:hypothetical protein
MAGMEKNVGKNKMMRISRQPLSVHITIDRKQPETVKYFAI